MLKIKHLFYGVFSASIIFKQLKCHGFNSMFRYAGMHRSLDANFVKIDTNIVVHVRTKNSTNEFGRKSEEIHSVLQIQSLQKKT